MEKVTLILLMTILILGFIISCDDVPLPINGGVQTFDYTPEFYSDLDQYLKDLNDNYSYFPKTGTYYENEFRKVTGYKANKIYPEIGTFYGISSIDELGYGIKKFKSGEKVRIRIFKLPLLICSWNAAQLVLDSKIYLPVNSGQVRIIF